MKTHKLYDNTIKIDFYPEDHRYILNDRTILSVTQTLDVISKPNLLQWASDAAVGHLRANPKDFKGARLAYKELSGDAMNIGSDAHSEMENFIKDGTIPESPICKPAVEWIRKNKIEFLECEKIVFSKKYEYVGTMDFLAKIHGKMFVGDFKTSKRIYTEYFLQTAAYKIAYEEEYPDIKIDGCVVVRIGKDGTFEAKDNYDFEANKRAFLSALILNKTLDELR